MNYLETVKKFVIENFLFGDASLLEDDTSFLEAGIIDSTGIIELIQFLEETCNIKVEDEELIPENLDSLINVVQFLERKLTNGTVMQESVG